MSKRLVSSDDIYLAMFYVQTASDDIYLVLISILHPPCRNGKEWKSWETNTKCEWQLMHWSLCIRIFSLQCNIQLHAGNSPRSTGHQGMQLKWKTVDTVCSENNNPGQLDSINKLKSFVGFSESIVSYVLSRPLQIVMSMWRIYTLPRSANTLEETVDI